MRRNVYKKRVYIKTFSFRKKPLEYTLLALCSSVFFILFLSQIGLFIPDSRAELTDIDVFEGTDFAGELPEATFVLETDSSASDQAVVLVNGAPFSKFSAGRCMISVLNRGLVEIDGRMCDEEFSVTVKNVDSAVRGVREEDTFLVGQGMTIIGRIEISTDFE